MIPLFARWVMDRSSVRHKGNSVTTLFLLDLPILTYTCCLPAFALETLVIIGSNIITIHLRDGV